jgi:hypothetical protein
MHIKSPIISESAGLLIIYNGHIKKYIELKYDNCIKKKRRIKKRCRAPRSGALCFGG